MTNVCSVGAKWVSRQEEPETPGEEETSEDWIYTSVLVERSADLMAADPAGRLRVACAAALDGAELNKRVELYEFALGFERGYALPLRSSVASAVQRAIDEETDYLAAELSGEACALCYDVTNFVVVLCSPHVAVDDELLTAWPRGDRTTKDAHWRNAPLTDPQLSITRRGHQCWSCGEHADESIYHQLHAGADTCVVVAAIGGEPSPRLRHFAELTGGAAVAINDPGDAQTLADVCQMRRAEVVAALDRRVAEHDAWMQQHAHVLELHRAQAAVERQLQTVDDSLASPSPVAGDDPELNVAVSDEVDAEAEEWRQGWLTALRELPPPVPADLIDVSIYVERSTAALAADPAGTLRTQAVDVLSQRAIGTGQQLRSYGSGLIAEGLVTKSETMSEYVRELMRGRVDHTRVDLAAALRQTEHLSGPTLIAVLGSEAAQLPAELSVGADHICPGTEPDDPVNHRPPPHYFGRYPDTVVFAVLGGEPSEEMRLRCEATGGAAFAIRDAADLERWADRCAAVFADMAETVEADCAAGLLDLDEILGF